MMKRCPSFWMKHINGPSLEKVIDKRRSLTKKNTLNETKKKKRQQILEKTSNLELHSI